MWRMEQWSMHKELQQKWNYNTLLKFNAVVHVQTNTITLRTLSESAENIQLHALTFHIRLVRSTILQTMKGEPEQAPLQCGEWNGGLYIKNYSKNGIKTHY